jgi:hypothetical protein
MEGIPQGRTDTSVVAVRRPNLALLYGAVAVLSALFVGCMLWNIGGNRVAGAVDDISEAVAAVLGMAGCVHAARRRSRGRRPWLILGAACMSWAAGEFIWSAYTLIGGVAVPFPSYADIAFLASAVLTVAAILNFAQAHLVGVSRGELLLDGAIVSAAVLFLSWVFILAPVYSSETGNPLTKVLGLIYPLADVAIVSVAIRLLVTAPRHLRHTYVLLAGGVVALCVSDSCFAYLTTSGTYSGASRVASSGWVVGFLLIGLAGTRPEHPHRHERQEVPSVLGTTLPCIAISLVGAVFLLDGSLNADPWALRVGQLAVALAVLRLALTSLQTRHMLTTFMTQDAILRRFDIFAAEQQSGRLARQEADPQAVGASILPIRSTAR